MLVVRTSLDLVWTAWDGVTTGMTGTTGMTRTGHQPCGRRHDGMTASIGERQSLKQRPVPRALLTSKKPIASKWYYTEGVDRIAEISPKLDNDERHGLTRSNSFKETSVWICFQENKIVTTVLVSSFYWLAALLNHNNAQGWLPDKIIKFNANKIY